MYVQRGQDMLNKYFYTILISSLLSVSCSFYLFGSYGTLELAILLELPTYRDFDALVGSVKNQEDMLQKQIFTSVMKKEDLHMTLAYPLIPLDEQVIKLFPRIQRAVEKLCVDQRAQAYRTRIPKALSLWLTPRVKKWFVSAEQWNRPIVLPYFGLHQLGKFLAVEFRLDKQGRLLHILDTVKEKLIHQFSRVQFLYDTLRPHVSLGNINPFFNVAVLMQPFQPIASLVLSKNSASHIVVSVRMKKEKDMAMTSEQA